MGIELDVLVGHPEHELLFVATQVARSAGLKDPGSSIRTSKRRLPDGSVQLSSLTALSAASLPKVTGALQWRDALRVLDSVQDSPNASDFAKVMRKQAGLALMTLIQDGCIRLEDIPADERDQRLRTTTVIFTESESYQMLLRGSAPQSEPFRKWVTEEVLPTIRKTGRYDASESSDPIAVGAL